jgi:hypothetical protein
MAQSIIRDRLLFFAVHFEGFTENYPFLFQGLQNILKGMWRDGPQNKGNSPSILFHASCNKLWILRSDSPGAVSYNPDSLVVPYATSRFHKTLAEIILYLSPCCNHCRVTFIKSKNVESLTLLNTSDALKRQLVSHSWNSFRSIVTEIGRRNGPRKHGISIYVSRADFHHMF